MTILTSIILDPGICSEPLDCGELHLICGRMTMYISKGVII